MEKTAKESEVLMSELVLPNDTNLLDNLLGGRLMYWVDIAGAMAAKRFSRRAVATVQVDSIDFKHPVRKGEMVELHAKVTWVGRTSMEVKVIVIAEDLRSGKRIVSNEAYLVFVALDAHQKPVEVPRLILETDEEKVEYEKAIQRRYRRLQRKP